MHNKLTRKGFSATTAADLIAPKMAAFQLIATLIAVLMAMLPLTAAAT
jgi:hypothetical protein